MRIGSIAAAVALLPLWPLAAQTLIDHEALSDVTAVDSTSETDDVVFRTDRSQRMTVPVSILGSGPYRFLVDTGADRTVISREVADRLNLEGRGVTKVHSLSGMGAVETAYIPALELSRKTIERIDAPMLERRHVGADGILGVDSLRSQRVLFDFKANLLSIVPSQKVNLPAERGAIVVYAKARKGHLILTQAKANDHKVSVVVDTGAEFTIGNDSLRRRLGIRSDKGVRVPVLSVTGDMIEGQMALIDRLDIGGVELRQVAIVFADAHTFRKLDLNEQPTLLLGMNAIRAFDRVSIDFANKKLRVVLPQGSSLNGVAFAARGSGKTESPPGF